MSQTCSCSSPFRRPTVLALFAVWLACGSAASLAREDHDRARQARQAGEVLPLRTILDRVEREYPGQVIDVELEREDGGERWVYEIKLLQSGGALIKLKVDARDGTVLGSKRRGQDRDRGRDGGRSHGERLRQDKLPDGERR